LSGELQTLFGTQTIAPLADAWFDVAAALNLPGAGATGIATGLSGFQVFGLSPIDPDGDPDHLDERVVVPPAAGMLSGALGTAEATMNLDNIVASLQAAGLFDANFGVPNYQDFDTGLVDESNPVRGTLEIEQMAIALLNQKLGGRFLEDTLRQNAMWDAAYDAFFAELNVREAEFLPTGDGNPIPRTNAGGDTVWHLQDVGDEVSYTIEIFNPVNYDLTLRYSNFDSGVGDTISILVDGAVAASFDTQQTNDWNVFVESPLITLGNLSAGEHLIEIRLDATDGNGIDLDRFRLHKASGVLLREDFNGTTLNQTNCPRPGNVLRADSNSAG
jgi:hypothetical protein